MNCKQLAIVLFSLLYCVITAEAQYIMPTCIDLQKQNELLRLQAETARKQLADTIVKLDRAWTIIAAYRTETGKLREEYNKSLATARVVHAEAVALINDYQARNCFLCRRRQLRTLKQLLSKTQ